ncbi:MAG: NAD-dependent epimerase/dehydratase family protein [Desulfopila sp.]
MKDVNVLVTGATGFSGSLLVEKLVNLGARVTAIHRRDNIPENLLPLPVRWLKGEVYDPEVVRQGCAEVEYIFHLAAAYRTAGIKDEVYRQVHVDSTQLLATEALNQPAFKRFVHVSTVGVHGHIETIPADETAPFNPGDLYQVTKTEAEQWIRQFAIEQDLPLTVIRPAAIYGPGDRRLLKIFRMARLPLVPILGFSAGYYHLIHVEDLTDCLILVASHPASLGQVFICGNTTPVRFKDMVRIIAKELGRHPLFIRLPAWPFFALGWLCEALCRPIGLEPPIYRRRVAFFTKDRAFDTRKLRTQLGFTGRYDNEEGLRELCRWYLSKGWL